MAFWEHVDCLHQVIYFVSASLKILAGGGDSRRGVTGSAESSVLLL